MNLLHEQPDDFKALINEVSTNTKILARTIEKDYYVTLILRKLAQKLPDCVFKGGTSLSKGFHAINRFSEDIDITFSEKLGDSRRKNLKNSILKSISEELNMPITNWGDIRSRRDYNAYHFAYKSVFGPDIRMPESVKLETALGSYSFPTQRIELGNYIGDYLTQQGRADLAVLYGLDSFSMNLQSLERTFVDKIFAICDYYLQGKSKRYSRHLYDIHKLLPLISVDENIKRLFQEVREHRNVSSVPCPSAQEDVCIPRLLHEICENDFYKEDYSAITDYFEHDHVSYEDVIKSIIFLADSELFDESEGLPPDYTHKK